MNYHGGNIYEYESKLLDFSSNINPLGMPESFKCELMKRLGDFEKYPDIKHNEVKESIANYLGINCADNVIPGNGAVELLYKLIASSGCSRAVSLSPTFSEYRRAAAAKGIEFTEVPAFNNGFEAIDIELILESIKPGTLLIICNPNNPTGTLIKKKDMIRLAEELKECDCRLLIDEAFIEFTDEYPGDSMVDVLDSFKNVTVIRAATKFFGMPGIRLGYAVTSDSGIIKAVRSVAEPWNLNAAAVIAASCIFKDENYIKKSRNWISTERKYLYGRLNTVNGLIAYPSSANFHLLKISNDSIDAWKLYDELIKRKLLIRLPEGFNNLNKFYFRLAVKDRLSNDVLLKALFDIMGEY